MCIRDSLESDGTTYSKELIVVKDPHSEGTIEDIKLQNDLMNKIYNDLNTTAMYVNSIESIRRQLIDLKSALSGNGKDDNLISEVDNLESKFLHIEKKLLQLKTTGKGQDVVRYQKMIGEKLAYLAENVQISDFRPADSYYEVYELLHKRLQDVGLEYDNLVSNDLEEFISKMNSQDINTVVFN